MIILPDEEIRRRTKRLIERDPQPEKVRQRLASRIWYLTAVPTTADAIARVLEAEGPLPSAERFAFSELIEQSPDSDAPAANVEPEPSVPPGSGG